MKKVLLVDHILEGIAEKESVLNRADLRILRAASAKEAFRLHQKERADLIIAELDLPDQGGDTLCSMIRQEGKLRNVSIILVCGDTPDELERAAGCGANARLTKPLQEESLLEKAAQLLGIPARRSYRHILMAHVDCMFSNMKFFCMTCNISVSGMMIETDKQLSQGDWLTGSLFLPGLRKIEVNGEVVRLLRVAANAYRYGIRFINLTSDHRAEIEKFIIAIGKRSIMKSLRELIFLKGST
jgi:CheY-like chemotaxis protein